MGYFLNPNPARFKRRKSDNFYVDKSNIIALLNNSINTEGRYICMSRARRFGKSMTASMIAAYYTSAYDTKSIFSNLGISKDLSYEKYINKFPVIFIDMQWALGTWGNLENIQRTVINDLKQEYPDLTFSSMNNLALTLFEINMMTGDQFVIIIDEWDCIFRNDKNNKELQDNYINFLRTLFKGEISGDFTALAYLTGILPIKKYDTESAMNNFSEYTMLNPKRFASTIGFTENEVVQLCEKSGMSLSDMEAWYNGYKFNDINIYNPNSVICAIKDREFDNYWAKTATYEALRNYIEMDFDGLKATITKLIAGEEQEITINNFSNDFVSFTGKDDVLTLLGHLGYLAYNKETKMMRIPNKEIREQFIDTIQVSSKYAKTYSLIQESKKLYEETLKFNISYIEKALYKIHSEYVSLIHYNSEDSLRYVILFAYQFCLNDYELLQEVESGKGFADVIYLPKIVRNKPALIIELKYGKSAKEAIQQIKDKNYVQKVIKTTNNILLIGINYNKDTKEHECLIEKYTDSSANNQTSFFS